MAQRSGGLEMENTFEEKSLAVTEAVEPQDESDAEAEALKDQIGETRANMGETIDAIQERLSFANISEQVSEQMSAAIDTAKNKIYDQTFGKAVEFMKLTGEKFSGTSVGRTIAKNPIPFALIGVGSALLIYNGMSKKSGNGKGNGRGNGKALGSNRNATGEGRDRANGITDSARAAAVSVASTAGDAYEKVADTASDTMHRAADVVKGAYDKVGEYGHTAHEKYDYYVEEKPLAVAAAAAAVGAVIGLSIPSTRYESRLVGETRDELVSSVGDSANQLVDRAKELAGDASQTIKDGMKMAADSASEAVSSIKSEAVSSIKNDEHDGDLSIDASSSAGKRAGSNS